MKTVTEISKQELAYKGENGFNYAMKHFSKGSNLPKLVQLIENSAENELSQSC